MPESQQSRNPGRAAVGAAIAVAAVGGAAVAAYFARQPRGEPSAPRTAPAPPAEADSLQQRLRRRALVLQGDVLEAAANGHANGHAAPGVPLPQLEAVFAAFLAAGADVVTANPEDCAHPATPDAAHARDAAAIARRVCDAHVTSHPGDHRFVAGVVRATERLDVSGGSAAFDAAVRTCRDVAAALLDGGVDLLLVRGGGDSRHLRAALVAVDELLCERGVSVPLMIIAPVAGDGCTASGHSVEALWNVVRHAKPVAFGLTGDVERLGAAMEEAASCCDCTVCDAVGLTKSCNAVLCGTPAQARAARAAAGAAKRSPRKAPAMLRLSGLKSLNYEPRTDSQRAVFLNVGERCNVAGSSIYKKAIVDGNYEKAAGIALSQVRRA